MLAKLTRIMLAFVMAAVMALVFTAQVEAATAHCARLSQEAAQAANADFAAPVDCHDAQGSVHRGADLPAAPAHHDGDEPAGAAHCECIAALKVCAVTVFAGGSTLIEPYAWAKAGAQHVASRETTPDWRPPRA